MNATVNRSDSLFDSFAVSGGSEDLAVAKELIQSTIDSARCCELIAQKCNRHSDSAFFEELQSTRTSFAEELCEVLLTNFVDLERGQLPTEPSIHFLLHQHWSKLASGFCMEEYPSLPSQMKQMQLEIEENYGRALQSDLPITLVSIVCQQAKDIKQQGLKLATIADSLRR